MVTIEAPSKEEQWKEIGLMFNEMYDYMGSHGLLIGLSPEGAADWLGSVRKTAGRFSCLLFASVNGQPAGFAFGALKYLPDYLGGDLTGVVTHVFVRDAFRSEGIGRLLMAKLEEWFLARNAVSVELQVVAENRKAMEFYEELGYLHELNQYRKFLKKS